MYALGRGVPDDNARAYAWFAIAAAQGHAGAKEGKEIAAKLMTPAQTAGGQKLSGEFWEKYVIPFQRAISHISKTTEADHGEAQEEESR
jgi:hypothetical protein